MIIQLSPVRRIFGGERAWELQRLKVSAARAEWRPYRWFPTLDMALRDAAHEEIRTAPVVGLRNALEAVSAVVARYSKLIDDALDSISDAALAAALVEVARSGSVGEGADAKRDS
jgi:hypothetical protein